MSEKTEGFADVVNIKCDCCGRMISVKPIKKVVKGLELRLCSQDCYRLYLVYKVGKH